MGRKVVKLDVSRPWHEYHTPEGKKLASPTADSLLRRRIRKVEAKTTKRVVIRHKREL